MAAYSSRLKLERWRQETHEFKASHIYICRSREMAQFVKCRLYKHEDSSLDSQYPGKKLGVASI